MSAPAPARRKAPAVLGIDRVQWLLVRLAQRGAASVVHVRQTGITTRTLTALARYGYVRIGMGMLLAEPAGTAALVAARVAAMPALAQCNGSGTWLELRDATEVDFTTLCAAGWIQPGEAPDASVWWRTDAGDLALALWQAAGHPAPEGTGP